MGGSSFLFFWGLGDPPSNGGFPIRFFFFFFFLFLRGAPINGGDFLAEYG